MTGIAIQLSEDLLNAIAERVGEILRSSSTDHEDGRWPQWMGVETAARYLDVSPERVRKLQARGLLPCYQEAPGCRVFFNRRELDDALASFRSL